MLLNFPSAALIYWCYICRMITHNALKDYFHSSVLRANSWARWLKCFRSQSPQLKWRSARCARWFSMVLTMQCEALSGQHHLSSCSGLISRKGSLAAVSKSDGSIISFAGGGMVFSRMTGSEGQCLPCEAWRLRTLSLGVPRLAERCCRSFASPLWRARAREQ